MFPPLKIAAGLERSRRCRVNGVKMSQGGSEMIFFLILARLRWVPPFLLPRMMGLCSASQSSHALFHAVTPPLPLNQYK